MVTVMDKNKFSKMCRLCMDKNVLLVNLQAPSSITKHSPGNILEVIEKFTTVKARKIIPQSHHYIKNNRMHFDTLL